MRSKRLRRYQQWMLKRVHQKKREAHYSMWRASMLFGYKRLATIGYCK